MPPFDAGTCHARGHNIRHLIPPFPPATTLAIEERVSEVVIVRYILKRSKKVQIDDETSTGDEIEVQKKIKN